MKKEYKIDTEIYLIEKIKSAMLDFEDIADIKYEDGVLEISGDNEKEIEEVFDELMNYIIYL